MEIAQTIGWNALALDGDWRLAAYPTTQSGQPLALDGLDWLPARVPGAVQHDLVRAGRLENPLASQAAAAAAAWVPRQDWLLVREFHLDCLPAASDQAGLAFNAVDTFSDVWLNGVHLGETHNQFRRWRFEIPPDVLRQGANRLVVHLHAHERMLPGAAQDVERIAVESNPTAHRDRSLIRRYQRSYNTSLLMLGENVIGIGITGPVWLAFYPAAYAEDVCVVTDAVVDGNALLRVVANLRRAPNCAGSLEVGARLLAAEGDVMAKQIAIVEGDELNLSLMAPHARLWQPHGYGEPYLYTLELSLRQGQCTLWSSRRRVGLKTVELVQREPNGRPTFRLRVNGVDIYVRGGNLMPVDALRGTGDRPVYERLLRLTVNAHMNLIRVWGGGLPEDEAFLDLCDELGILLWQDFFYHSCTYPDHDAAFMAEAEREARDVLARLRPHACLALLCGGNEQVQGWDEWNWREELDRFYGARLMDDLLPRVCAEAAPELPYIPNSPHGGKWCQSPVYGDTHTWGNFVNATRDPLFVTETCWNLESYSRSETLREAMGLEVDAFGSFGWHRAWRERTGLRLMGKFAYSHEYDIATLRRYLRALEIEQAEADYAALAHLRFRSPSCQGIIYWPLNKGGPLFSFGCIDYGGRPLMAYAVVQRLFVALAVHLYRDGEDVRVVGSNLGPAPVEGVLELWHVRTDGSSRGYWRLPVTLPCGQTTRLFDLSGLYAEVLDRTRELVTARLTTDDAQSEDRLLFCPFSEFEEAKGHVTAHLERLGADNWLLRLETSAVAKLVEIECASRLMASDNYFTLAPGAPRQVRLTALETLGAARQDLCVTALGVTQCLPLLS